MNSMLATHPHRAFASPKFRAALEVAGFLGSIAAAILCFLVGWVAIERAAVLTLFLLLVLISLAWRRFEGGHPCFLFLSTLTLFQGGRLLAYCAGGETDLFRITLMTAYPFDVSRDVAGMALLSIAVSAICIYVPCRWNYRSVVPLGSGSFERCLPYFYLLLNLSLPVQLYKNFRYYEYVRDHGGYLVIFTDHGGMAASIPVAVRAISLISLPAFVGIFVLESRKRFLRIVTTVYFAVTAPILLTGSRGAVFSLVLSLWYISKVKSGRRAPFYSGAAVGIGLILAGSLIGWFRTGNLDSSELGGAAQFIAGQGASLNVTEVAIAYRERFAPRIFPNLADELQSAFFPTDHANYIAGKNFDADVSFFLNPVAYQMGQGGGSSYVAEAYVAGGLAGVVAVSALLGMLFHDMHLGARSPRLLFLIATTLPDILLMPRGGLLDWVSASFRVGISVFLLLAGWHLYRAVARVGGTLWRGNTAPCPPRPLRLTKNSAG